MITGHASTSMDGLRTVVELRDHDGKTVLLKAYCSPDGKKIRMVLPELKNMAQSKIDMDHGLIDFTRDARRAKEELKR